MQLHIPAGGEPIPPPPPPPWGTRSSPKDSVSALQGSETGGNGRPADFNLVSPPVARSRSDRRGDRPESHLPSGFASSGRRDHGWRSLLCAAVAFRPPGCFPRVPTSPPSDGRLHRRPWLTTTALRAKSRCEGLVIRPAARMFEAAARRDRPSRISAPASPRISGNEGNRRCRDLREFSPCAWRSPSRSSS